MVDAGKSADEISLLQPFLRRSRLSVHPAKLSQLLILADRVSVTASFSHLSLVASIDWLT
jgi:hypothetical protein